MTTRPTLHSTLLACCLAALFPAAHAAETASATTTTATATATASTTASTTTAVGTSATTEARLSAEFADFLGGTEQAGAVVSGLRQGTAFSLDAAAPTSGTPTPTTSTAIDPPTGTMGYGNVRIALRLAQAELNKLGITQPTPEELSAVLLGGDINGTAVDGILALRSDGMGWGQIARKYGMSVGQIMGKGAGLTQTAATGQPKGNGYISSSTAKSAPAAHANGYIPSGKTHGTGIVTAAGGSVSTAGSDNGKGQTHKASTQGAGAASGGGQHVSMAGGSNAGGAKGMAPGLARKN